MFSSVTKPISLSFSKTGSCLTPLSIMSFAILDMVSSGETFGAARMSVFTLVDAGSSLDLRIHRRVITPVNLPFASRTARTGGISVLNASRHLDSVSLSFTAATLLV